MQYPDYDEQRQGVLELNLLDQMSGDDDIIMPEDWGADHWNLLLYLETVTVDRRGFIGLEKMRTNAFAHFSLAWRLHDRTAASWETDPEKFAYPSRLKPGVEQRPEHDDWDCLVDLRRAELLTFDILSRDDARLNSAPRSCYVHVAFTEKGSKWAAIVRQAHAQGVSSGEFWRIYSIAIGIKWADDKLVEMMREVHSVRT